MSLTGFCISCRKELVRGPGETSRAFSNRVTCGGECRRERRNDLRRNPQPRPIRNGDGMLPIDPFVEFINQVLVDSDDRTLDIQENYSEFIDLAWKRSGRYKSPKAFTHAIRRYCRESNRIHIDLADDIVTALGGHPASLWADEYYEVAAAWDTPILEAQSTLEVAS